MNFEKKIQRMNPENHKKCCFFVEDKGLDRIILLLLLKLTNFLIRHVAVRLGMTPENNCDGDDPNLHKEPTSPFFSIFHQKRWGLMA
jgi:hypothetical protein